MDKKMYLSRFSRLARWRLPADEAEEVINDYAELLDSHPEEGTALVKVMGDPDVAVKLLGITGEYACWMAVFVTVCLSLLCFITELLIGSDFLYNPVFQIDEILFYLSIGVIALWKWKNPKGKGRCPGLISAILGMLIPAAMLASVWIFFYYDCCITNFSITGDWIAPVSVTILSLAGCLSLAAALTGLIWCRTRDRRWLIVTAMAMTVLFLSLELTLLIRSLDNAEACLPAMKYMMRFAITGTIGVIWTLC